MSEAQSGENRRLVQVRLSGERSYSILLGEGMLAEAGSWLAEVARSRRAVIISQPKIAARWAPPLQRSLVSAGFMEAPVLTFPPGERYKNLATVTKLCQELYNLPVKPDRKTLIVALGGGVVGDVAGFVASIYLRGLDYIQVPTTLLAMVDSSVGGKTGVDFLSGKNLIGTFHQPRAVIIDIATLETLPSREFRAGMAEVVKYGVIRAPELLVEIGQTVRRQPIRAKFRQEQLAPEILTHWIQKSCQIKADVVEQDEFETTGLRAILNFGHTVGHALEAATAYRRFKHGEAVAMGMMAAAFIGEAAGITSERVGARLGEILTDCGLPVRIPTEISPDHLLPLLALDKKAEAGKARFVLAQGFGDVALYGDIEEYTVRAGLERAYRV